MTISEFKIDSPNFTQMPNILLDKWLPFLKEIELKVLLTIYRKTFGWQKRKDVISLSQLMKSTGSSKTKIIYAVDLLVEKKLISKVVIGDRGQEQTVYEIIISEPSNSQVQEGGCPKVTGGGDQKSPGGGDQKSPTKERYINKKENITKEKPPLTEAVASLASKEAHDLSSFSKDEFEINEYLLMKYNEYRKSLDLPPFITVFSKKTCKEVQGLLKEFSKDRLISLINFAFEDDFWKKVIESPFSLKKNLRRLETAQANTKKITSNPTDNYEYAKLIEKKLKKFEGSGRRNVSFEACRKYFEINFHGKQPFCLDYTVKDFKNQLDEALKQYNFNIES